MPLQIITGDLLVNKKQAIIEKILDIKANDPQAIIYYIIPEHLKFDMESYMLEMIEQANHTSHAAMIDIQVVSFTRLAWFMLPAKDKTQKSVSAIGVHMIVRQILKEHENELIVYRGQVNYQGFVDKLVALFEELYEGNIIADDLDELIMKDEDLANQSGDIPNLEAQRLKEISLLYQAFFQEINQLELANYQTFHQLSHFLDHTGSLPHHYIIIDHHYYFNAQEMSLIIKLLANCQQVWITLPLSHQAANSNEYQPLLDTPKHTYIQLRQFCQFNQLEVLPDWDISQAHYPLHKNLIEVAQQFKRWQRIGQSVTQTPEIGDFIPIELWHNDSVQTELKHVSNQINYLVTEKGYRYKDILVVARDMDRYQTMIQPYFAANNIPVFIDHTTMMDQHPFVLVIEGLLNVKINNYQYDDIMAILKSDLVVPPFLHNDAWDLETILKEKRHQLNYFENILLANGYFVYRLTSQFEWHFEEEETLYLNSQGQETDLTLKELVTLWRDWFNRVITRNLQSIQSEMTGSQAVNHFYQLINHLQIKEQMILQRDSAIETGNIEVSRRDEQVWQTFIDLLDEFYHLYETVTISYDLFAELLLTGFYESSYHIIPATLDQVMFTSMESPQVQPYKIAFIMGADEESLPKKFELQSLLDDTYREKLKAYLLPHQYLMNINQQHYNQELLLTYQLLLNATDYLYISYANSINNHSIRLSPYFQQIINEFDIEEYMFKHHMVAEIEQPHTSTFGQYAVQRSMMIQSLRHYYEEEQTINPRIFELFHIMEQYEQENKLNIISLKDLSEIAFQESSLPTHIKPETALELFGKNLHVSVSKIEQYFLDPFSHFLLYGLRLKERKLYDLDYAQTGDYFHEFLDQFTQKVIQEEQNIKQLSQAEIDQWVALIRAEMAKDTRFNILASHPRFTAVQEQMDQRLKQFIAFSQKQQDYVNLKPLKSEAIFGLNPQEGHLQGFTYQLDSGGQLSISGKIDRIDSVLLNNRPYLQVIDYKSSQQSFDLVDVYYGLDLQVLTYLSVALANYPDTQPLGAFYQPLLHQFQKARAIEDKEWQELQLTKNRLNGFITVDEEQLSLIDASILDTNKSLMYPVNLKKDGTYTSNSNVFTPAEIQTLLAYVHYKFKEAANNIQKGIITLSPFQKERYTPALQKEYRVISGFDATENYELYRQKDINKKDVLPTIKDILGESEEENNNED